MSATSVGVVPSGEGLLPRLGWLHLVYAYGVKAGMVRVGGG